MILYNHHSCRAPHHTISHFIVSNHICNIHRRTFNIESFYGKTAMHNQNIFWHFKSEFRKNAPTCVYVCVCSREIEETMENELISCQRTSFFFQLPPTLIPEWQPMTTRSKKAAATANQDRNQKMWKKWKLVV